MKRYLSLLVAVLLFPVVMFAQATTSGTIEGTITDASGEPLPGANIVAIHQPTGTRYGTVSRADGGYTFKNVQVGGPYQMQVTFVGYNAAKKQIDNVKLGETVDVNFSLEEGEMSLDEISVIGHADQVFNANKTGAGTNVSRQDIETTPTISRSLSDFTRLNPQVTGDNSFGGANNRYNNILVDGATLNDVFGLSDSGTPGGQAGVQSPISIDAIQEFNVDIAPFEVTNNGFTGGQVNAVTKSGTNQFSGSAYYQFRNESLVGNYKTDQGVESNDYPEFNEHYLGLSIGGPIIKDKLFFFVNGEFRRRDDPLTTGIAGSDAVNQFPLGKDTFNTIQDIAQNQYGYDPGGYGLISQKQDNNKILAKLNWNINDNNKLMFRYNMVDAVQGSGLSRYEDTYSFSNAGYDFNSTQNSFVAELNSEVSNSASNTFRAVYTRIRDKREVKNKPFPYVDISLSDPNGGYVDVVLGTEQYSQANSLDQDLIELTDDFTYIMGDHELTVGTNNQIFHFDNLFVRNAFGAYEFRSIEDFQNGNPYTYEHSYLLPDGNRTANFSGIELGFYAQDKWSVNDYLKVTLGLRADIPILPDNPTENSQVSQSFPGYSTSKVASGNILWSPRFGFNWDLSQGSRTTQLRGGAGIFSGDPPFVWISNQYGNTGNDYGRLDLGDYNTDALDDGFFVADPQDQPSPRNNEGLSSVNTTEVNLTSKDFKYPQSAKFDLALDQELPWGMSATVEGIYSKMINEVTFKNINLEQVGTSAYGRPFYGSIELNNYGNASGSKAYVDGDNFTDVILLDNTSKGYQYSLTGEVRKQFDNGFRASISYTYNRAETINNASSSQASSNWIYNENFDVNNPELGPADYERRNRILAKLSYRLDYAERFATTISLIYDGRSGQPFSWIYEGDANGDGSYENDLIYVPESQDEVVMYSDNWDEFNQWIENTPSVNKYRGEHVPRGSAREPWSHYLDLRINQEIQTFGGQKLELTASMFNVLNFLNKEWGQRKYVSTGFNNYEPVTLREYDGQGRPVLDFNPNHVTDDELYSTSDLSSRWQLQFGLRYSF